MRGTYGTDDRHQFQTCADLAQGCKAFGHKIELHDKERQLSRWRFRVYIAIIILLEFLFVIISVLLAPKIICTAIQQTQETCRQNVKGAQTLLGIYTTVFFVWGIVVAVLVYSMCRRRRQDVNTDRSRRAKQETAVVARSPEQSLQSTSPTIRTSTRTLSQNCVEERQRPQSRGNNAQGAIVSRPAGETGMGVRLNAPYEHERQDTADLGTRPMLGDGSPTAPLSQAPPPYSALNLQVTDTSGSVVSADQNAAANPERSRLDDHEIQRMFHSRMYPNRQWNGRGRPG